jgi:YesN/AraC family two-component response regulator
MDEISELAYTSDRKSILIVGNAEGRSEKYKNLLRNNFKLYCADSGISAISQIEQPCPIDLLLLEHRLPDRSWVDVLKAFRASRPTAPAIVVTGSSCEEVAITALRCGATDYIKKPCSTKELIASINSALVPLKCEAPSGRIANQVSRYYVHAYSDNFQRALSFVNENYTLNPSLSRAAETACLSYHHFSKVFKKNLGIGFRAYINKKRIDRARELLVSGDMTITYIALSVGFEDLTNFERVFKGLTSYTPSEYRDKKLGSGTSTKKAE